MKSFDKKDTISSVELVEKFNNKMNKTTVYRILERLEKANILHSFNDKRGNKKYAKNNVNTDSYINSKKHSHFECQNCGFTSCLEISIDIPIIPNHQIKDSEHLFFGKCKDCLS